MENNVDAILEECTEMLLEVQSLSVLLPQIKQMMEKAEAAVSKLNENVATEKEDITSLLAEGRRSIRESEKKMADFNKKAESVIEAAAQIESARCEIGNLLEENKKLQWQIANSQSAYDHWLEAIEKKLAEGMLSPIGKNNSDTTSESRNNDSEDTTLETINKTGSLIELLEERQHQFPIDVQRINSNWPPEMHFVVDHIDEKYAHGAEYMGNQWRRNTVLPLSRPGFEFKFYKG